MKTLHVLVLAFALWLVVAPGNARAQQSEDLDTIVAQFYPDAIDQDLLALDVLDPDRDVLVHKQCFAVLQANSLGVAQTILAGYTNHSFGAVRVLTRLATGGFRVAAHSQEGFLTGTDCSVDAIDLDKDGQAEGHVAFASRENSSDWVYRWQNGVLSNITPVSGTTPGNEAMSAVINAEFFDVDGDGKLEIYSWARPPLNPEPGDPVPAPTVYKLSGGSYILDRRLVLVVEFVRSNGNPQTQTLSIVRPTEALGPFTLRVLNGTGAVGSGQRVENAVNSGRVWFDGQEIVRPSDFGNQVSTIVRTVTLQATSELSVRLAGAPGGRITIVIESGSWTP